MRRPTGVKATVHPAQLVGTSFYPDSASYPGVDTLAAKVEDIFSRMALGWSMVVHHKTDVVVDAVTMAVARRGGRVPDVIRHSGRSGEYTSPAVEREPFDQQPGGPYPLAATNRPPSTNSCRPCNADHIRTDPEAAKAGQLQHLRWSQ